MVKHPWTRYVPRRLPPCGLPNRSLLIFQASVEAFKNDELATKFLKDETAQKLVKNTVKLSSLSAPDFDAIFYVGGHGPIVDLAVDKDSIKLIEDVSRLSMS